MFTRQNFSLFAIVLIISFATTACASLADTSGNNTTAKTESSYRFDRNPGLESIAIDKSTENWAKERSNYLRSLDYEKIARQGDRGRQYMLKANLIESRYDIKNSEIALYDDHDMRTAMMDLRDALKRYKHAARLASQKELPALGNTEQHLETLVKRTGKYARCCCENPDPGRYHNVEASIETLLARL